MIIDQIHHIISMERGQTSNSSSPMWRCQTEEGARVNIFQHQDAKKNSFALFEVAGYGETLLAMELGERLEWTAHPIEVTLEKKPDDKWWEIVWVKSRPVGAEPDTQYTPDPALHRKAVESWAGAISGGYELPIVIIDTETTGLGDGDEIIDIAVIDIAGDRVFESLVQPRGALSNVVTNLTGITPDMLANAPEFAALYDQLATVLNEKIWLIYNAPFDMGMLDRACVRAGLPPLRPLAVTDVMERFAEWYGDWDAKRGEWVKKSLQFACECLDIFPDGSHRAQSDATSTLLVVNTIAEEAE